MVQNSVAGKGFLGGCSMPKLQSRLALAFRVFPVVASLFVLGGLLGSGASTADAAISTDLKIVSHAVGTPGGGGACTNPAPATIPVGTNVTVCVRKVMHNNGPGTPVDMSITKSAAFIPSIGQPANECTVAPTGGLLTLTAIPSSTPVTRDENFVISCSKASWHKFRFSDSITPGTPGATDPDTSNNSATSDLDVCVTAQSDFSIVSQEVKAGDCVSPPPTQIVVSTDVVVCLVKVVHNAGPYGPATGNIFVRTAAAPGCTIVPFVFAMGTVPLQVSMNFTLTELYTIHCFDPSFHTFLIENFVNPADEHVSDPNGTAYAASQLTVAALAQSDVKISAQSLSGPGSAQASQPFALTLNKTLHNNGTDGPAAVSITNTVSAPPDCTVDPDPLNPTSDSLSVSLS